MYATLAEMDARYGEAEMIQITDRANLGVVDEAVLDKALADAADEIDSYVAQRYALPLPTIPPMLVRISCDVARYRLYDDAATKEVRDRYDDAVRWLIAIANGKASLGLPSAVSPATTGAVAKFTGEPRRCSRTALEDF